MRSPKRVYHSSLPHRKTLFSYFLPDGSPPGMDTLNKGILSTGGRLTCMTNPWLPHKIPPLRAYILAPGVVQIEDAVYNLPEKKVERGRPRPEKPEFIIPVKENSENAARAAMEALYRIVFD
jgi:hypothetical protein